MKNLDRLLPQDIDTDAQAWATVTALGPLRIKLDGESTALPFTPDTLAGVLAVNDRVRVAFTTNDDPAFSGRRALVLGKAGGDVQPWTTYTPTFGSSGTAPALGNGILEGHYLRTPHLITAQVRFVAGSTTTFGTGELRFGMPLTNGSGFECFGSAIVLDSGTTRYSGTSEVGNGNAFSQVVAGSSNFITATNPFTFTTNDEVLLQIAYPV